MFPNTTSGGASTPPTTSSGPTEAPSGHKLPGKGVSVPVEAILGILFGVTGIVGAILGFVIWRLRRPRLTLREG